MTTQFRLGDAVPGDAVWDACAELGLRLSNVVPRTATHPAQSIFVTADRQTMLHLIEDEAAGRAVILRGTREQETAAAFAKALGAGTGAGGGGGAGGDGGGGAGGGDRSSGHGAGAIAGKEGAR